MLVVIALLGCGEEPALESVLPPVWGPEPAGDLDPDPDVVEVELTASKVDVTLLDGTTTPSWAYNGQVPGPLIQVVEGQTLRVVFTNDLPDPTTIHWHGMRVPNDMDGVPAVQDPVQPGETFTYEFVAPDPGSYWYHPHVRTHEQMGRGLHGALVVHEADAPGVVTDRYFVLDDAALKDNGKLYPFDMGGMDGMHGRHGNVLLANGSSALLTDTVRPGAPERWRVVNTANARTMWIDVKGADWRVVAIDGTILEEPYEASELLLPVGRRFDLEVVPRPSADTAELLVKLPRSSNGWDKYPMFEGLIEGPGLELPEPVWRGPALPAPPQAQQTLVVELGADTSMGLAWTINGATYTDGDTIPVLGNTPTDIIVTETSGAPHPFHLHGQFFQQIAGPTGVLPGLLDTLLVDGFEEVVLHSQFENPGTWMAHCHILEHAELGMMTAFEVSE